MNSDNFFIYTAIVLQSHSSINSAPPLTSSNKFLNFLYSPLLKDFIRSPVLNNLKISFPSVPHTLTIFSLTMFSQFK